MSSTYWSGQRPVVDQDSYISGMSQVSGMDSLDPWLEQALDPMKVSGGIDLAPYMQGVNIAPGGLGSQAVIDANMQAANTVLSRLYADRPDLFRGGQFKPWGSFNDFTARQNTREGFSEGGDLGSFLSGGVEHLGDTASELWAEPGVRALIGAGTAGAFMGGGLGGPAAAGAEAAGAYGGMDAAALAGADYGIPAVAGGAAAGAGAAATDAAGAAGTGSILSNLTGVDSGLLAGLGIAGATGLGVYGANKQADALRDISGQEDARIREMMGFGAPYRERLSNLYADPNAFLTSPEVMASVDQGTGALARALSTRGNPAGNPSALQELQNYSTNQLFGRLGQEKDRLAGFGGLTAYSQGAAQGPNLGPSMGAINAEGGVYDSVGFGLNQLTRRPRTLADMMRELT